ncbi:MAG: DUF4276 family protein [Thermoanaerobaculaceae bacterium]
MVEDPSTEAFLRALLPRVLPEACTFDVHSFQDKPDLLNKLADRLRGYAKWLPADWRIVVVVDRDNDDCHALKEQLEAMAAEARLRSRSRTGGSPWQVVNRIAIEELEAWYFGDWKAVCLAYPKAPPERSESSELPRPRCGSRRHIGSTRAHPAAPWLLQDGIAQS